MSKTLYGTDKVSYRKHSSLILSGLVIINCLACINEPVYSLFETYAWLINGPLLFLVILINSESKFDRKVLSFAIIFMCYSVLLIGITQVELISIIKPIFIIFIILVFYKVQLLGNNIYAITLAFIIVNIYCNISAIKNGSALDINPNIVGMFILYTMVYISVFISLMKLKHAKGITVALLLLSIAGLLSCESRTNLLVLLVFVACDMLVPKKFWYRRHRLIILMAIIIVMGFVIPIIYTFMYQNSIYLNLRFISSKSFFTGRQFIWGSYLNYLNSNIKAALFGLSSNVVLWNAEHNFSMHNAFYTMLTTSGIIGCLLYYSFCVRQVKSVIGASPANDSKISLIIIFIAILVCGYFETSVFWGNISFLYFFPFACLGLADSIGKREIAKYSSALLV